MKTYPVGFKSSVSEVASKLFANLVNGNNFASNDREIARLIGKILIYNSKVWKKPVNPSSSPIDVIDLFCGCGGASAGFLAVNHFLPTYRVIGAMDVDRDACRSYGQLGVDPHEMDVRLLARDEKILNRFLRTSNHDPTKPLILVGCPPCQGFSSHRKKNWDDEEDGRNYLVEYFAKIAVKIQPDYVFMENVPELLSEKYQKHYSALEKIMRLAGYNVVSTIVNMAEFGLPQARRRAIVLASRGNVTLPRPFLKPEEFLTVRSTISHLEKIKPGVKNQKDQLHITANHRKTTIDVIRSVPRDGGNRPKGIGPKCLDKVKGFSDVYGRLRWDSPSITITAYARNPASGRYVHPEQNRGLSIREAAMLQGFPYYYKFEGSFDSKFSQIGNAVPPLFASYMALHILSDLAKNPMRYTVNETCSNSMKLALKV
ncbi:MAG: DNA cytosine methyltransferase [Thaumarchaeota archaeon]|nr:DNA cytosine methyltransferase [Nitrososphaerota archaeon]